MDRVVIPLLDIDALGMGQLGWWMDDATIPNEVLFETDAPIFQSPCCNKRTTLKNHSIECDGTVNASIKCLCGEFHVWGILESWPSDYRKPAGSYTVERRK
jgi:hypothetical protein